MDAPRHWQNDPDPLAEKEHASFAGVRHDLSRVPRVRLLFTAMFVLLAILLARFSWQLPWVDETGHARQLPMTVDAERALYDLRALFAGAARPVAQDRRILLVAFTPDTQLATGKRSPLDRAILARAHQSRPYGGHGDRHRHPHRHGPARR